MKQEIQLEQPLNETSEAKCEELQELKRVLFMKLNLFSGFFELSSYRNLNMVSWTSKRPYRISINRVIELAKYAEKCESPYDLIIRIKGFIRENLNTWWTRNFSYLRTCLIPVVTNPQFSERTLLGAAKRHWGNTNTAFTQAELNQALENSLHDDSSAISKYIKTIKDDCKKEIQSLKDEITDLSKKLDKSKNEVQTSKSKLSIEKKLCDAIKQSKSTKSNTEDSTFNISQPLSGISNRNKTSQQKVAEKQLHEELAENI